jgi:hypothetical protein
MNEQKQSGNEATSQDHQNKTNLKRELTGEELNNVAGGANPSGAGAGKITFGDYTF